MCKEKMHEWFILIEAAWCSKGHAIDVAGRTTSPRTVGLPMIHCDYCHKWGHIELACVKKKIGKNTKHIKPVSNRRIQYASCSTPVMVTIDIEGRDLDMEVDTRSASSVIAQSTFKAKFADLKLQKSRVLLKTYTNESRPSDIWTSRTAASSTRTPGCDWKQPAFLRLNWLQQILLDWTAIPTLSSYSEEPTYFLDHFVELLYSPTYYKPSPNTMPHPTSAMTCN